MPIGEYSAGVQVAVRRTGHAPLPPPVQTCELTQCREAKAAALESKSPLADDQDGAPVKSTSAFDALDDDEEGGGGGLMVSRASLSL